MAKIELTRRRILGGLVTIGAGSAAAGAGTFALFSDTENDDNNTISAGTLDLQVGETTELSFSQSDIVPQDAGTVDTDLTQSVTGDLTTDLKITVDSVSSTEGGTNPESESNTDTSDDGELDDQVELDIWIGTDSSDDNSYDSASDVPLASGGGTESKSFEVASDYAGTTWDPAISDFSGPVTFNVDWRFRDDAASTTDSITDNNAAQGDDLTIDFKFELLQQDSTN